MQDARSYVAGERRKQMGKLLKETVKDGNVNLSMFALVAKTQGQWKIVTITVPH